MKSSVVFLLALLVAVSPCLSMPDIGKTEVGGNFWFRYHLDRMDESTQRSAFTVERGYIGLGHRWTPQVGGQMTLNVFSSPDASGMTGWNVELRDAYVDLGYFIPNGKIRAGLQKNYFGTVHDWKYMTVRRSLADAVGVVRERDYGIAFLGTFSEGMGEWSIGIMNGEGFSSGMTPAYADKQPAIMANVRFTPIVETMVGFSVLRDKRYVYDWDYFTYDVGSRIGYEDRTAMSVVAKWGSGPMSVLGEYLYHDYPIPDREDPSLPTNVKGSGFSIVPKMRLTEKMEIVGRYDTWDPDKDSDCPIWEGGSVGALTSGAPVPEPWWLPSDYDSKYYFVKHNVYVVGFNYNITERMEGDPGVLLQVNWQRMDPQEDIAILEPDDQVDAIDSFVFQVRWGWGGLDF
jgi:hypothetical protein